MIATDKKTEVVKGAARNAKDTGSPEVQVSILTARIAEVTDHLKTNKHDHMARRGLLQMVGKRKRLLQYLARKDGEAYIALTDRLKLRRR